MTAMTRCAIVRLFSSAAIAAILIGSSHAANAVEATPSGNPLVLGAATIPHDQMHPFVIDDLLGRRDIREVRPSALRSRIAVTITRPTRAGEVYVAENRVLNEIAGGRDDLIVLDAGTGVALLDSRGLDRLRSVSAPTWSPDGRSLAFLGIERDGGTRLYIWNDGYQAVVTYPIPPVRQRIPLRAGGHPATDAGLVWIDNRMLAFVASPGQSDPLTERETAWNATRAGEPSVRVWRTAEATSCRPNDTLTVIAADNGEMRSIASGPIKGAAFSPLADAAIVITAEDQTSLANDGRKAFPPQANLGDYQKRAPWRADIIWTDGGVHTSWLSNEEGPISTDSLPDWSLDGQRVYAVTRRVYVSGNGPVELVMRDLATGRESRRGFAALHSAELAGDLYLLGRDMPEGFELPINPGPNFAREPRTEIKDLSPDQRQRLSDAGDLPVRRSPPVGPSDGTVFDGFAGEVAIFHADTPDGTFLWSIAPDGSTRVLLSTNTGVAAIVRPEHRSIAYEVGDAERSGVLYLPTGQRAGDRLPLVVTAYPGFSAPRPRLSNVNSSYDWQLQTLLANGFAVFVVDFRAYPKDGPGTLTERIMREMTPAIAAARRLPEIDPDRIGFYGHSYGSVTGFTVLGRSHDFKAAVISAPVADLARYGLSARPEVSELPCSPSVTLDLQELQDADGFIALDGPIADHVEDYLRQSPIWTVGEITTPVLMIRGEQDGFNGADELFTALAEHGVAAELATYRAEPHSLESPGNIRDAAERIVRWFKIHLETSTVPSSKGVPARGASEP